jgi:LacI family transcriptional regulator
MKANISDVAREAGVSAATVSRVLNDDANVADQTKAAVQAAIEKTSYERPQRGRRGRPRKGRLRLKNGCVSLLFPDPGGVSTALGSALAHGMETWLHRRDLSLIVNHLREGAGVPPALERGMVDGLVIRGLGSEPALHELLATYPAVVAFGGWDVTEPVDQVLPDNEAVGLMAAEHLGRLGHRQCAVMTNDLSSPEFRLRAWAFRDALERAGGRVEIIERGRSTVEEAIARLAALPEKPTGLFIAEGPENVYGASARAGRRIWEEMEIISCSNTPNQLALFSQSLTWIDIRTDEIGAAAAELLLRRIRHPDAVIRRVLVMPELCTMNKEG